MQEHESASNILAERNNKHRTNSIERMESAESVRRVREREREKSACSLMFNFVNWETVRENRFMYALGIALHRVWCLLDIISSRRQLVQFDLRRIVYSRFGAPIPNLCYGLDRGRFAAHPSIPPDRARPFRSLLVNAVRFAFFFRSFAQERSKVKSSSMSITCLIFIYLFGIGAVTTPVFFFFFLISHNFAELIREWKERGREEMDWDRNKTGKMSRCSLCCNDSASLCRCRCRCTHCGYPRRSTHLPWLETTLSHVWFAQQSKSLLLLLRLIRCICGRMQ